MPSTNNIKDIIWDTTAPPPVTTGINLAASSEGKVMAYPNPCGSQVNFSSTNLSEQYVSIYDLTGRKMDEATMKNGKTTLNTSNYSNGVYLFMLSDQSGNVIDRGKFTVQK